MRLKLPKLSLPKLHVREWCRDHKAGLVRAGKIGAIGGSIALVVLLVHREVYSLVLGRKEYTVKPEALRVTLAPKWTGGQHGVAVDLGPEEWSAFDDEGVARVGKAFERNPWVRRVTQVERVFPDQVRVKFEYRMPYATVRTPEGWIVVDQDLVRLPGVWKDRPPRALESDITGLGKAPDAGRPWDDPALAAAIELAELAETEQVLAKSRVEVIDVTNLGGRVDPRKSELAMLTGSGCIIYWGRPTSTNKFGELTVAQKLDNLKLVLQSYPELDGLQYVKVYCKEPIVFEKDGRTTRRR